MTKNDVTSHDHKVLLSLEDDVDVPTLFDSYANAWDMENGVVKEPASLSIEVDSDSALSPTQWVWFEFFADNEPWFRLTFAEAAEVRDRLNHLLEGYDALTDEQKNSV